jgi:tetratricopeptide (TPR) repeat protein
MRRGAVRALALVLLLAAPLGAAPAPAAVPLSSAVELFNGRRYAEARAILEPLAAAEPGNADAAYYLGMSFLRTGGPTGLDSARLWLGKAVKLAPDNAGYLGDYAGVCLLMADRDGSFSLALEGRDAMTRAIAANPGDLEARDGLVQFYAKAPWPLGSIDKALSMAAEIARRDPKAGAASYRGAAAILHEQGRNQEAASALREAEFLTGSVARR